MKMPPPTVNAALRFLILLLAGVVFIGAHASDSSSALGSWRTVDDKTGMPRAIVRIFLQDGKYFGRIERGLTPAAETRRCVACKDERKDQPMIGLLVIRNMTLQDGEYVGGDILDPDDGSVYRCKIHLDRGGNQLLVRGFIGIPLLGRSQIWHREN
jgi:uncharacterized protein (DUF2147 family)